MESVLAQLLVQASRANVARTKTETIELANELVNGTAIGQRIIDWKLKHVDYYRMKYEKIKPLLPELGSAWFYGFMNRHPELTHNKHVNIERYRDDWCTHANIRHMYKHLYNEWALQGYILPTRHPHFQDEFGNEVSVNDKTRLGYKVKYEWAYPERMLMADEVGHNTCMARDRISAGDNEYYSKKRTRRFAT